MFTEEQIEELKEKGNYLIDNKSIFYNNKLDNKIQYIKVTDFYINKELEEFEINGINLFNDNWTGTNYSFKKGKFKDIIDFIYDCIELDELTHKDKNTVYDFIELNNKLKGDK